MHVLPQSSLADLSWYLGCILCLSGVENISFQLPVLPHQSQTGDEVGATCTWAGPAAGASVTFSVLQDVRQCAQSLPSKHRLCEGGM
jgi:hypothetical protein